MTINKKVSNKLPANNRAAIYVRVSTEDQANEGYGIEVQIERCKAQAVASGLMVVHTFEDRGISGTKGESERPGLASLLAAINEKQVDNVIVLSLDRLGRKTTLVLNLVEKITAAGVALLSVKDNLDTSTAMGQFVLTILAGLAQLERDTIVERTTAGRNLRGTIDGEMGGRVHYGYTRKNGIIEIDESKADTVRQIFALRQQGLTMQAIADSLTAKPMRGDKWYASSIKSILDHESDYSGGKRGESDIKWPKILA
jgi:site-specific DNA recombinase